MDERAIIAVMSGEARGVAPLLCRGALTCASWGYAVGVAVRNAAFDAGLRRPRRVAVPVISLGNVTTGGTGKTPLAAWFVRQLQQAGYRPGLLSRGYRSLDGMENDEARVLAALCPGVPHVQRPDRVAGAATAVAAHGCDALILDDGFQHRRLHRDLDVVLIDALAPWGFGRLLPRGLLREPLSGLRRADLVLITRADLAPAAHRAAIVAELRRWRGDAAHAAIGFRPLQFIRGDGAALPLEQLAGASVASFCGIGNPTGFEQTLAQAGWQAPCRRYPDHHHYTSADWDALEAWRRDVGAQWLLTTLKDLVKLPPTHPVAKNALGIELGVTVLDGAELLQAALERTAPRRGRLRAA